MYYTRGQFRQVFTNSTKLMAKNGRTLRERLEFHKVNGDRNQSAYAIYMYGVCVCVHDFVVRRRERKRVSNCGGTRVCG